MQRSFNKIWIPVIWTTKESVPQISGTVDKKAYEYFCFSLRGNDYPVSIINGIPYHIHRLFSLNPAIVSLIQQIQRQAGHMTSAEFGTETLLDFYPVWIYKIIPKLKALSCGPRSSAKSLFRS